MTKLIQSTPLKCIGLMGWLDCMAGVRPSELFLVCLVFNKFNRTLN